MRSPHELVLRELVQAVSDHRASGPFCHGKDLIQTNGRRRGLVAFLPRCSRPADNVLLVEVLLLRLRSMQLVGEAEGSIHFVIFPQHEGPIICLWVTGEPPLR